MSYLSAVSVVLGLVYIEQTGQAEVGDLHVGWVLNQDIAGSQIPVHQPDLLQITHPLHTHTHTHLSTTSLVFTTRELISHQI